MSQSDSCVTLSIENTVAILRIDRAEKLNALDDSAVKAISECCHSIEHTRGVRTVIITGSGAKAFSAGGDIESWSAMQAQDFGRYWVREGHAVFDAIARLRQPVIAVLNGHALGGGFELAATADIRIAESHIKIGQPETGLGIIPGWSGTQRAVRRFGAQIVRRMALFGEVLTAEEALTAGLVDEIVPSGGGLDRARKIAARIEQRSPVALELTKMLINAAEGEERERVLETLAGLIAAASEDLQEGVGAFRERRKPKYSGD